jgi:alcohol dehydrogenase
MNPFLFVRPPRILFGPGTFGELGKNAASFGPRVLLVTGASSLKSTGSLARSQSLLVSAGCVFLHATVCGEPSPVLIDTIVRNGRDYHADCVVAIGGGSVLDAGKAVSAMLPSGKPVKGFLEDVGAEKPVGEKVPMIAIPTTSGTGSEATANAVLCEIGGNGYKKSLRHPNFVPDMAIVDPDLTANCPPPVTASCGMDAFTQLLESFVSAKASPMTDALAKSGLERVRDSLVAAFSDGPENPGAREGMAYAALMSGITLANAGLGAVHGIAGVIGGRWSIPHGAACGSLVGPVTRASIKKLFSAAPRHPALRKYAEIGHLLSGSGFDTIENGCDLLMHRIDSWTRKLHMPCLGDFGVAASNLDRLAAESMSRNNPVELDKKEMLEVLNEAL